MHFFVYKYLSHYPRETFNNINFQHVFYSVINSNVFLTVALIYPSMQSSCNSGQIFYYLCFVLLYR